MDILINFDKCLICLQTRYQYSWSIKIKDSESKSYFFYYLASIIQKISFDEWHLLHIFNSNIDSEKFRYFCKGFRKIHLIEI